MSREVLVIDKERTTSKDVVPDVLGVDALLSAFDAVTKNPPASEPFAPVYIIDSESIIFGADGSDRDIVEHPLPRFLDVTPQEVDAAIGELMEDESEWEAYRDQFDEEARDQITPETIRDCMLDYVGRSSSLIQAANILCEEKRVHLLSASSDKEGWLGQRRPLPITLAMIERACGVDGTPNSSLSYMCTYLSPMIVQALVTQALPLPKKLSCDGKANGIKPLFYGWISGEEGEGGYWLFLALSRLVIGDEIYYDPRNVEGASALKAIPPIGDKRRLDVTYRVTVYSTTTTNLMPSVDSGKVQKLLQRYYEGRGGGVEIRLINEPQTAAANFILPQPALSSSKAPSLLSEGRYKPEQVEAAKKKGKGALELVDIFPNIEKLRRGRNAAEQEYITLATNVIWDDEAYKRGASGELIKRLRELGRDEEETIEYVEKIDERISDLERQILGECMAKFIQRVGAFSALEQALEEWREKSHTDVSRMRSRIQRSKQLVAEYMRKENRPTTWHVLFAADDKSVKSSPPFNPRVRSLIATAKLVDDWTLQRASEWNAVVRSLDHIDAATEKLVGGSKPVVAETTTDAVKKLLDAQEEQNKKQFIQQLHEGAVLDDDTVSVSTDDGDEGGTVVAPSSATRKQPPRGGGMQEKEGEEMLTLEESYDRWMKRADARFFSNVKAIVDYVLSTPLFFFSILSEHRVDEWLRSRTLQNELEEFQRALVIARTRFDGTGLNIYGPDDSGRAIDTLLGSGRFDYYGPSCPLRHLLARWTDGGWELMMRDNLGHFLLQAPSKEAEQSGYSKDTLLAAALAKVALDHGVQSTVSRREIAPMAIDEKDTEALTFGEKIYVRLAAETGGAATFIAPAGARPLGNVILGRAILRLRDERMKRTPSFTHPRDITQAYPPGRLFLSAAERSLTYNSRLPYDFDTFIYDKELSSQPSDSSNKSLTAKVNFYDFSRLRVDDRFLLFDISYREGLFQEATRLYFPAEDERGFWEKLVAFVGDVLTSQRQYLPQPLHSFRKMTWATLYDEAKYNGPLLDQAHRYKGVHYRKGSPSYLVLNEFYEMLVHYGVYVAPGARSIKVAADAFFYEYDQDKSSIVLRRWSRATRFDSSTLEFALQVDDDLPLLYPIPDDDYFYALPEPRDRTGASLAIHDLLHALWIVCRTARMDALTTYGPLAILSFVLARWRTQSTPVDKELTLTALSKDGVPPAVRQLFAPGFQGYLGGFPSAPSIPSYYVLKEPLYAEIQARRIFEQDFPPINVIEESSRRVIEMRLERLREQVVKAKIGSDAPTWILAIVNQSWKWD